MEIKLDRKANYLIKKIGNRDEPENYNQTANYEYTGKLYFGDKIVIDEPVFILDNETRELFNTSRIRTIYEYKPESNNDKLVLTDFPAAADLDIPELVEGDILLGTMNSVYLLREVK